MGKKGGGRVRVVQKGPKMPNMTNPMADFAIPPGNKNMLVEMIATIFLFTCSANLSFSSRHLLDEELQLPIKPPSDSGYLFWPMGEFF